jgi:multiple sugar transport system ATP-binding protein
MVYVTHDQVEAMTVADKIVALRAGHIERIGSPHDLYQHPRNRFVAGFMGSPKMNIIDRAPAVPHGCHAIGVRPEHPTASATGGLWRGTVTVSEHLGSDKFPHMMVDGIGQMNARVGGEFPVRHGDIVFLRPEA